ncbi:hypothetical protein Q9R23_14140 [Exiguobacterium sp. BRG2]|uniref:hypothetical protein n=1 Tax=unclassified Exiguobacterium TaxID=2644629 RepID=UPI0028815178|nr:MULTISPECIES: hypothetical protein [unclassified Exiguobacterium]MDT0174112.1 hypothetical protein [Exiguobacterium sp. BRG2]
MASSCCNNDSSKESAPKEGKNASLPTTTCCTSSADTQRGKADQTRCCTTSELAGTSLQTEPSESPPNDTETCCSKVPLEKVNPDDASCCASSSPGSASNLATRATYTYRIEGMGLSLLRRDAREGVGDDTGVPARVRPIWCCSSEDRQ